MRLVVYDKAKISKADFDKALALPPGQHVTKLEFKEDCFKATVRKGIREIVVCLRCPDMNRLFGIDQNIFGGDWTITKEGIEYQKEREVLKQNFNLARLQAAIRKELTN